MSIRLLQRKQGPTVIAPTVTTYSDDFTGTNGAAPKTNLWKKAASYPTGPVTIQANAMQIAASNAVAWSGAGSIFLGDVNTPQGNAGTGLPAIASDWDYTFRYTLKNLTEHYPSIALRARSAELWPGGGGQNLFTTGMSLVLGPSGNNIDLVTGYDTNTVASVAYTFTTADMRMRILVKDKRLAFKIWAASLGAAGEPGGVGSDSNWTYNNLNIFSDESDGSIGFSVFNGPAAETKTVTIDDFVATTPILTLGASVAAPTTDPSPTPAKFVRFFTENFDTPAVAGSGAGNFLDTYSNSFQPYAESAPAYQQRSQISAHDGVMDIAMDGTKGVAGMFGTPTNAFDRKGGRFAMRAKAIGAYNNGPAVMIWPSSDAWVEGEIDFPESVSGNGGIQGFQDAPWIHHHTMNTATPNDQSSAQDVPLDVSWRDWHVYSAEWFIPGKAPAPYAANQGVVIYYVDEVEVYRTTVDVPTTNHRYTVQTGYWGAPGNMYIDWVTMSSLA